MALDTGSLVLLGIIALLALVQGLCLVGLGREVVKTAHRVTDLGERLVAGARPTLEELNRASQHLAASSSVLAREGERLSAQLEDAVARVERAQAAVHDALVPSATRVASVFAAARLVRAGLRLYRFFK
ncbi:MAG TPA: hypothetical protein VII13_04885 [Vicinamibacteria bacterium]|jgi:hypothetical protein